ncbi:hypothetical protein LXL04_007652 [Taraxacum kok-saghyz]
MEAMTVDMEEGSLKQEEVGSFQSRQNVPLSFESVLRGKFHGELFFHEVDQDVLPPPVIAHRALPAAKGQGAVIGENVAPNEGVLVDTLVGGVSTSDPLPKTPEGDTKQVGGVIKEAIELPQDSGKQTVENVSVPTVEGDPSQADDSIGEHSQKNVITINTDTKAVIDVGSNENDN